MLLFAAAFAGIAQGLGNQAVIPASFFFGAAAGPVALLVATHDRIGIGTAAPMLTLVETGLFGGGVALLLGGLFDELLTGSSAASVAPVGFIEEPAKLVPVVVIAMRKHLLSKRSGVALGMAVATGFAVLESMSYAYQQLHGKHVLDADAVLLTRGLTTPFSHLAWTGIFCAVAFAVWQRRGKVVVTPAIVGALLLVCVLHSANDVLLSLSAAVAHLLYVVVAVVSYWVFHRLTRDLKTSTRQP